MFKIGSLVKYDNGGVPVMARVEGREADGRYRINRITPGGGERLTVPQGDIALPGGDVAAARREASRSSWRYVEGGISNGMGGMAVRPAPNPDYVGTGQTDNGDRH